MDNLSNFEFVYRWMNERGKHGLELEKVVVSPLKANLLLSFEHVDKKDFFLKEVMATKVITRPENVFDWSRFREFQLRSLDDFGWKHMTSIQSSEEVRHPVMSGSISRIPYSVPRPKVQLGKHELSREIEGSVGVNYTNRELNNRQCDLVFDGRKYLIKREPYGNDKWIWQKSWDGLGREAVAHAFIFDANVRKKERWLEVNHIYLEG